MFLKRSTLGAIGVLSALTLATACHGPTGSKTDNEAAKSPTAASSPAVTTGGDASKPTTSATASNTQDTIVLSFCPSASKGIRNVEFVKSSTGEITKTNSFVFEPMKYNSAADCNSNMRGAHMRSIFNGDFTEVGAANDLWHVGIIKANHGFQNQKVNFVDLATGLNGKPAVSTIQQSSGAFGSDGWVYAAQKKDMGDNPKLIKVNPNGGAPQVAKTTTDLSGFEPTSGAYQLFFTPGGGLQTEASAYQVFSPDGRRFVRANDGTITYGETYGKTTTTEPNYGHTVWPIAYAGPKKFYAVAESGIIRATIDGKNVKEQPLIPATSNRLIDPTVSSDGTSIAYIEETDTARTLYVVPTNGGPRKQVHVDIPRDVLGVRILDYIGK